jgi:hypothetical protein
MSLIATEPRHDHLAFARELAARPEDWPFAPRFNPAHRWYHQLVADPVAEAWLLTWLPGQGTDLHDHGGSAGAFVVVSGTLTEQTVVGSGRLADTRLAAGAGRRFGPHHVHRITNHGARPAISLHVYGPALTSMTRYHLADRGLEVTAVERAGEDW